MKTIRRRRRESKTDYKARLAMLKSSKPRLVVRKSNRYITVQLVDTHIAQDKVRAKASSKELLQKGWPKDKEGSLKSLVASYLTGYLLVKKLKEKPHEIILDSGLNRSVKGSRIFAALQRAIEAGLNVPHSSKVLPSEEILNKNEKPVNLTKIKEKL